VLLANLSTLAALVGNVSADTIGWSARVHGLAAYARFGGTVQFVDVDADGLGDLVVGAPLETIVDGHWSLGELFAHRELGAVYVWAAGRGSTLPKGNHSTASTSWQGRGTHPRGRFGAAVTALPGLGLVVGAPRATGGQMMDEMVGVVELCQGVL
jgi:hypothetical protein